MESWGGGKSPVVPAAPRPIWDWNSRLGADALTRAVDKVALGRDVDITDEIRRQF